MGRAIGWTLGAALAVLGWADETLLPALAAIWRGLRETAGENWPFLAILALTAAVILIEAAD